MKTDTPLLSESLRGPTRVGSIVILLFFGVFGGWATYAPLAQGTLAPGTVSPDGSRRTVQHYEGGIIQKISVREGDRVKQGDTLAVLQQVRVRSEYITYYSQLLTLLAEQSRLVSEKDGLKTIHFDPRLTKPASVVDLNQLKQSQQSLFTTRQATLENQKNILIQRIKQHEQQIDGLQIQIKSLDRQTSLINEEIKGVQALFDKGLERKPRLLALQRTKAQIDGAKGKNIADIARAKEAIGEAELEVLRLRTERDNEISNTLAELQDEITEAEQGLARSSDAMERTVLSAPVDGTILNLKFKTIGGVIKAGEAILDIVPARDRLVIDARVSPLDIDIVHPGLSAEIVLTAYPRRSTPTVQGQVEWVSADINKDENTNETYFSVRIIVTSNALNDLPDQIILHPGMPAEVMIISGERTALDYLIDPLLSSLRRSFKES